MRPEDFGIWIPGITPMIEPPRSSKAAMSWEERQLAVATALSYTIKQGPIESHFHAPDDPCDERCHTVIP
jgi:hypothetical protein